MVLLEQRLSEVTADLVRIESKIHEISDVARLRGSALLRADSICNHLQALLKGVADPSPEQWGKTTELERLESGIGGWPGVTADVKPPNATFRLYGGAAFDRVVLEFRCAVYSMECPVVSREKVANILLAHNGQGGRDGTTETAAEISRAIARTWFSPILDITCDWLAFVLCNLFDIAMERNRQHYSGGQRLEYMDHYVGFDARLRHSYNCFIKDLAKQCKEVIGIFLDSATSPYSQYCYENDVTPSFILVPRINQVPSELHCLEPSDGTPKLRKDIINGQETIPREKSATTRGKVAKSREAIREGQMTVPETPSPDQPRVGKYGVEKERGNSLKDKARKKRKATGNNKFMGSFSSQNDGSHSFETARESESVYSAICSDVAQHFTRIRAALVETGVETNLKSRFLIPCQNGLKLAFCSELFAMDDKKFMDMFVAPRKTYLRTKNSPFRISRKRCGLARMISKMWQEPFDGKV